MKLKILLILLALPFLTKAQITFSDYFQDKSLRFDFNLAGNFNEIYVFPVQMKQEPFWAGSKKNLTNTFDYGIYQIKMLDSTSGALLFSKGFTTLFDEWQKTDEARQQVKAYHQTAILPFPLKKMILEIDVRQKDGNFKSIYSTEIDPENYFILKEKPAPFQTVEILKNGDSENHVDLIILAEGYTKNEMEKFIGDAKRVTGYLFEEEPFKSKKNKFNVTAVCTSSEESGTDVPGENIYKNTRFNSSFYTFDTPRYLTISDLKSVYDAAAIVPHDQIYVLVNTGKYGGGGFYNNINVCSSDNSSTKEVFVHEFGHGFAGLGDEYYTSSVAFGEYYNFDVEPWEPNLTTLVDFEKKWKAEVSDSVPVPTPRIAKYENTVGAFEGGGYVEKGVYSPFMDCRMKSNVAKHFCPVCQEAIINMISYYSE